MSHIEGLLNIMRRETLKVMGERGVVKIGIVSSYNPNTYSAKVKLQPEDVESGWLPVTSPWIGNGWGLFAPPSIGDMVDVHFVEGDRQVGFVSQRFFNDEDRPQLASGEVCPSGEFWLVHKSGASLKLSNDGKLTLNSAVEIDASAPTVHITCATAANVTAPQINLGAQGQALKHLVNEQFMALFNAHTHALDVPHGLTLVPVVPMDASMLTSAVKAG